MTTMTTMTTTTTTGLSRMTDDDYETEFSTPTTMMMGTPRPGMDNEDQAELQLAASIAIWTFSQAAKSSAASIKRRRSPKTRTAYKMSGNTRVNRAFDELEKKEVNHEQPSMTQADFQLLKEAFGNYRVKFDVHESKTLDELRQMQTDIKQQEEHMSNVVITMFKEKDSNEQAYIDAKDKYIDLKMWNAELTKEIRTLEPKSKYSGPYGTTYVETPPGVPSQHAQISQASAAVLRNILSPETKRRTFISLNILTQTIREEVIRFLTDEYRKKDRAEVVEQIKTCVMAKKKNATQ